MYFPLLSKTPTNVYSVGFFTCAPSSSVVESVGSVVGRMYRLAVVACKSTSSGSVSNTEATKRRLSQHILGKKCTDHEDVSQHSKWVRRELLSEDDFHLSNPIEHISSLWLQTKGTCHHSTSFKIISNCPEV